MNALYSLTSEAKLGLGDEVCKKLGTMKQLSLPEGAIAPPYSPLTVAIQYDDDGELKSLLDEDWGTPYEDSLAALIIKMGKGQSWLLQSIVSDVSPEGKRRQAKSFQLPMYAVEHNLFKPSVYQPVSNAMNVSTEYVVEVVLAFEDGYIYPFYRTVRTRGMFASSAHHTFSCLLMELSGNPKRLMDDLVSKDFYVYRNVAAEYGFNGYTILCSNDSGRMKEISIDDDELPQLSRHIASMRLVSLKQTIH